MISRKERNSASICSILVENEVWRGHLGAGNDHNFSTSIYLDEVHMVGLLKKIWTSIR